MESWMTIQELLEHFRIGRTKYYDLKKLDGFPKANTKLGPRSTRYSRTQIQEWMEA